MNMRNLALLIALILTPRLAHALELKVAVASNFANTMSVLAKNFEQKTGHSVVISSGSTGKHFAQIKHGAPFDVFFAADKARPELLEQQGLTIRGTRSTYAIGKLVLWQSGKKAINADTLHDLNYRHLAIANPRHAPYGVAAKQTMETLGIWDKVQPKLVRAENINQSFQFIATGNAELGFVSLAQARSYPDGTYWLVPSNLYAPIEQQMVILKESAVAHQLLAYFKNADVQKILRDHGYDTR